VIAHPPPRSPDRWAALRIPQGNRRDVQADGVSWPGGGEGGPGVCSAGGPPPPAGGPPVPDGGDRPAVGRYREVRLGEWDECHLDPVAFRGVRVMNRDRPATTRRAVVVRRCWMTHGCRGPPDRHEEPAADWGPRAARGVQPSHRSARVRWPCSSRWPRSAARPRAGISGRDSVPMELERRRSAPSVLASCRRREARARPRQPFRSPQPPR
jgi:hypothetical protein